MLLTNVYIQYIPTQISGIIEGRLASQNLSLPDIPIQHLLIDSRKLIAQADSSYLFFAIKGGRHNGHIYISELYNKGVRNFVVSEIPSVENFPEACFINVKDTLKALQQLSAFHRKQFQLPLIAITGSNGKTIVKEWLHQLLSTDRNIIRSPKSYNSQVGVPLSVWQIAKEHQLAIIEAGISQHKEMEALQAIIQPTIGIITNIGDSHDEFFKDKVHKTKEKLKLFSEAETLIYCKDHTLIENEVIHLKKSNNRLKCFTWSNKAGADLHITHIHSSKDETEIKGIYQNNVRSIHIPFIDDASIENAIHCWATMLFMGYDNDTIAQRMTLLHPVAMRLELLKGIHSCTIVNDSYNSDIGSLAIAIDFMNQQKQHQKTTLILSDILQSGKEEKALYKEVAGMLAKSNIHRLIGIGDAIARQSEQFNKMKDVSIYQTTEELLNEIKKTNAAAFNNEAILIKGARSFSFERISKLLQQKLHNTILEIDLNALVDNLNYFRSVLHPTTKVMAVVKAFSYGSGSYEIANLLQFQNIDYLGVAFADEGVELRKAGITTPIMVMNPDRQSFSSIIKYQLEPEIYAFNQLHAFYETLSSNFSGETLPFPIHIKIDTGMHRLGFDAAQIDKLIVFLKQHERFLAVKSIFTHLAASDEELHDDFTHQQLHSFEAISQQFKETFPYPIMRHVLNSSGIQRFPEVQYDMVRLGIGLYGINHLHQGKNALKNVSTLRTTISQVKAIKKGESIGYSRKAVAKTDMRIAIVSIGYADGLDRRLSNGKGKMWVNNHFVPIVGNVCMDMCMLDMTNIKAEEGDEVIVFGKEYPITAFAKDIGTIPYEVLTGISNRVKRVYYQE